MRRHRVLRPRRGRAPPERNDDLLTGPQRRYAKDGPYVPEVVALMRDDLSRIPFLIELARKTRRVIAQNIIASIVIAIIGLLVSLLLLFGWWRYRKAVKAQAKE